MTVDSVSITDCEQMKTLLTAHVRRQGVSVLVDFVRITWLVATRRRERKLGYGIEPFPIGCFRLSLTWLTVVVVSIAMLVVRIMLDVLV